MSKGKLATRVDVLERQSGSTRSVGVCFVRFVAPGEVGEKTNWAQVGDRLWERKAAEAEAQFLDRVSAETASASREGKGGMAMLYVHRPPASAPTSNTTC